jgi:hypothetical protein
MDQPFASSLFAHPVPQNCRRASGDLFRASLLLENRFLTDRGFYANNRATSRGTRCGSFEKPRRTLLSSSLKPSQLNLSIYMDKGKIALSDQGLHAACSACIVRVCTEGSKK